MLCAGSEGWVGLGGILASVGALLPGCPCLGGLLGWCWVQVRKLAPWRGTAPASPSPSHHASLHTPCVPFVGGLDDCG